jgi:ribonucleoside-diphosphate reductase alpha chain
MPYLGWVSETLAERDALLGIGMTGMLDSPKVACDPEYQRQVATKIKEWNAEFAAILGIQPAARTTCVKPSGTTSLELGCVASGHHAHHAKRYIRRVTADELEHVFQAFKAANPHMCVRKPDGKWVIEFPVEAPEGAIVKDDIQAIPFLEMVQSTQQNWVLPGTARPEQSPGLNHNVSNTATVQTDEWDKVADYLWENREFFTGVSMLASTGDKDYAFAPNEAITTVADESRWNAILAGYKPVNYMSIVEASDDTNLSGEAACAGGACLI